MPKSKQGPPLRIPSTRQIVTKEAQKQSPHRCGEQRRRPLVGAQLASNRRFVVYPRS